MDGILKSLGLKGTELPARSDDLTEAYLDVLERGLKNGYTPVIIFDTKNDPIAEIIDGIDMAEYTARCLRDEPSIEEALKRTAVYAPEACGADDEEMEEALLIPEDARAYLVELPTDKPYTAFAYLPFLGGYGDCPAGGEHIAFAREWYAKFGALPMAVSPDSVQYYVPHGEKIKGDKKTVKEILAYCPSIAEDIPENMIDTELSKVKNWFFYWE